MFVAFLSWSVRATRIVARSLCAMIIFQMQIDADADADADADRCRCRCRCVTLCFLSFFDPAVGTVFVRGAGGKEEEGDPTTRRTRRTRTRSDATNNAVRIETPGESIFVPFPPAVLTVVGIL